MDVFFLVKGKKIEFGAEGLLQAGVLAGRKSFPQNRPHLSGVLNPLDETFGGQRDCCTYDRSSGPRSLFIRFLVFPILTFHSPILYTAFNGIAIEKSGRHWWRLRGIDCLPATFGDHLNLECIGPG